MRIASATDGAKWAQDGSELSPDGFLDRVVAAGCRRAEPLLGEQGRACLTCGVVGEDEGAVRACLLDGA